jgi:hypothetical protein
VELTEEKTFVCGESNRYSNYRWFLAVFWVLEYSKFWIEYRSSSWAMQRVKILTKIFQKSSVNEVYRSRKFCSTYFEVNFN